MPSPIGKINERCSNRSLRSWRTMKNTTIASPPTTYSASLTSPHLQRPRSRADCRTDARLWQRRSGRAAGALAEARAQPVAELDVVGQLPQFACVYDNTLLAEGLSERVPVVGLHVVLGTSTKRLVRPHHHARGLDDVTFPRDRPEVVDPVRAGSAQLLRPAAIVKQQQPAAVLQHRFMARRHRDATRVNVPAGSARSLRPAVSVSGHGHGSAPNVPVLTNVCAGHETNHSLHQCILAKTGGGLNGAHRYRRGIANRLSSKNGAVQDSPEQHRDHFRGLA